MNRTQLLAWLVADGKTALQIWQRSHPDKEPFWYTFDPQIKAYWKSPVGRINKAIIFFFQDCRRLPQLIRFWRRKVYCRWKKLRAT